MINVKLSQKNLFTSFKSKLPQRQQVFVLAHKLLSTMTCSLAAMLVRTQAGVSPVSRIFQLLFEPGSMGDVMMPHKLIDKISCMFVRGVWRLGRL